MTKRRRADPENRLLWWGAAALALLVFSGIYFLFYTPPAFPIGTADEAEILAARPPHLSAFRFRPDPNLVVLDFPSARAAGEMLDRLAAFTGQAGVPRTRVLRADELAAVIRAGGAIAVDGHAYAAADLVRFFRLMVRDRLAPGRPERRLRVLLATLRWFTPGAVGAIVPFSGDRAALARGLAEGAYLTDPAYAVYAQHFFHDGLTPAEQDLFRRFLAARGRDTGLAALVVNETQASLLFAADPARIGLAPARLARLRAAYERSLPLPWLAAMAERGEDP